MYFSDIITLRLITRTADGDAYWAETNTDKVVCADAKTATRLEFYEAAKAGVNADIVFAVHQEDWNEATQVVYNTKVYDIKRVYKKGLGVVDLTCSEVVR